MEPVSPELVLVDPVLAERVQARLPQPDDTLARVDSLVQASRRVALAQRSTEIPRRPDRQLVEPTRRIARRRQGRSAALAGGVAAGTLVIALMLGVRVDLAGNPAGADTTVLDKPPILSAPAAPSSPPKVPPKPQPKPKPVPSRPAKSAITPEPQRFAWAPDPDASGYHVELFRDSSRVFDADTKRPALTIPAHWRFGGRSRSLEPGDYRWYVWPVFAGQRAARAIVQAKLTIPPR